MYKLKLPKLIEKQELGTPKYEGQQKKFNGIKYNVKKHGKNLRWVVNR